MRRTLRISIAVTLAIGITITVIETMRGRLEHALVALRTKERDEADARRAATEAQLASLESRVQPHFLFNTLNSIAALIPQDPAAAEKMTGQLASLLRSSLDIADHPLVPLRQEFRNVRDYLEIERVRFGDRLQFSVSCPADLEEVRVPRFAVQTLVENSVKYAVSPRRAGGTIRVSACGSATDVSVTVEDDGPGFDASEVPAQHGLALLRDRLRLSFGDRAGMHVDTRSERTAVTVVIPR
jgi:LytS/YehU family sensor histidine kinase